MARFANAPVKKTPAKNKPFSLGPAMQLTRTGNGAVGFKGDPHVELFNAAVTGLLADNFYEKATELIALLINLVPKCDPAWLQNFIPWLRTTANLRSAPIVLAAEYAKAGFPNSRGVIASTLTRADEPAELLGYWMNRYGRNVPSRVKRGISDALQRIYSERSLLRYDGGDRAWRFGDVIEFVHPKAKDDRQNDLFRFALDRRRHSPEVPESLRTIRKVMELEAIPAAKRKDFLAQAGETFPSWERLAGWLPGGMTAAAWEAIIPTMGYMALIRNLNNFDRVGVSRETRDAVIKRITDAEEIRRSRLLPFRFLSAYKALEGDNYRTALADAVNVAVENLPYFDGHTLIMVDVSGSMQDKVGGTYSTLQRSEIAGFLAESVARRCEKATIVTYDTSIRTEANPVNHVGILKAAADKKYGSFGGTNTWSCTRNALTKNPGVKRVIILTDEQSSDSAVNVTIPVITWNLAGYDRHHAPHGASNFYLVSGFSDTALQTLPDVIAFRSTGKWPWE